MAEVPFVRVVWSDAWVDTDAFVTLDSVHAQHKPMPVETIGWLIADNPAGVSIANERCLEEEGYRGRTFVPRGMIVSMDELKMTKPRKKRKEDENHVG